MLRAEIQRALRRAPRQLRRLLGLQTAGVQIIPLTTLANQILARTFLDPSRIYLRIQPLKNSAGRVPQAADGACNKM